MRPNPRQSRESRRAAAQAFLRALCPLCVCPDEDQERSCFKAAFLKVFLCVSAVNQSFPRNAFLRALCLLCVCPDEDQERSCFKAAFLKVFLCVSAPLR